MSLTLVQFFQKLYEAYMNVYYRQVAVKLDKGKTIEQIAEDLELTEEEAHMLVEDYQARQGRQNYEEKREKANDHTENSEREGF